MREDIFICVRIYNGDKPKEHKPREEKQHLIMYMTGLLKKFELQKF